MLLLQESREEALLLLLLRLLTAILAPPLAPLTPLHGPPILLVLRVRLPRVKLVRIIMHELLREPHRIRPLRRRHVFTGTAPVLDGSGRRLLMHEEVLDGAGPEEPLVHGQRRAELLGGADLDGVEELQGVRLAVVRDEVVGGLPVADALDDRLAGAPRRVVVEGRLADLEGAPLGAVDLFVGVDDVEVLVLGDYSVLHVARGACW